MARTAFENIIIFGLPFSMANLEKMQRAGVAFYQEGLTNQQRARVLDGTTPIQTILLSAESANFQEVWSASPNGSTQDWYIGSFSMRADHWARLQAFVGTAPVGLRYCRAYLDPDDDNYTIMETNVGSLNNRIGQKFDSSLDLLTRMGLRAMSDGL